MPRQRSDFEASLIGLPAARPSISRGVGVQRVEVHERERRLEIGERVRRSGPDGLRLLRSAGGAVPVLVVPIAADTTAVRRGPRADTRRTSGPRVHSLWACPTCSIRPRPPRPPTCARCARWSSAWRRSTARPALPASARRHGGSPSGSVARALGQVVAGGGAQLGDLCAAGHRPGGARRDRRPARGRASPACSGALRGARGGGDRRRGPERPTPAAASSAPAAEHRQRGRGGGGPAREPHARRARPPRRAPRRAASTTRA